MVYATLVFPFCSRYQTSFNTLLLFFLISFCRNKKSAQFFLIITTCNSLSRFNPTNRLQSNSDPVCTGSAVHNMVKTNDKKKKIKLKIRNWERQFQYRDMKLLRSRVGTKRQAGENFNKNKIITIITAENKQKKKAPNSFGSIAEEPHQQWVMMQFRESTGSNWAGALRRWRLQRQSTQNKPRIMKGAIDPRQQDGDGGGAGAPSLSFSALTLKTP